MIDEATPTASSSTDGIRRDASTDGHASRTNAHQRASTRITHNTREERGGSMPHDVPEHRIRGKHHDDP
jgi:hypothetical protein